MESLFDNSLFLIPFSSGIIFVLAGFVMLKFPPKKINMLYGYRTNRSMKSQERWNFAQKIAAIMLMKLGGLLAVSSVVGVLYHPKEKTAMILGLGLMIAMVVLLLLKVESAIASEFDK